jgi:hypothetical protein
MSKYLLAVKTHWKAIIEIPDDQLDEEDCLEAIS